MFVNGSGQNEQSLNRGPSIDASYQVSVHMAEGFQRRRLKCEKLTDDRWRTTDAKWWQNLILPLARWAKKIYSKPALLIWWFTPSLGLIFPSLLKQRSFYTTISICCLWDISRPTPQSLILVGTLFAFIFGIFHFQSYFFMHIVLRMIWLINVVSHFLK
jgi:hypothetical protein